MGNHPTVKVPPTHQDLSIDAIEGEGVAGIGQEVAELADREARVGRQGAE